MSPESIAVGRQAAVSVVPKSEVRGGAQAARCRGSLRFSGVANGLQGGY